MVGLNPMCGFRESHIISSRRFIMCEFCTKHGEGKKWYLEMKNYAEELLYEELSASQKEITTVATRLERSERRWANEVMPAIRGWPRNQDGSQDESSVQPDENEFVARQKVESFAQVLPIEDVEQVIDMVDSITRLPCGCRFISTGETDKRYCFGFGIDPRKILGKFPDAASSLEVLDKEDAKRIFREYDKEGLMHSIWTNVTPYIAAICNCDRDCMPYKLYIEENGPPRFFRAEYVCQVDWEHCTGCKSCMRQCQFGAMFYSSGLSRVYIDAGRCFGCGVCRAVCPHEAITLIPRQEHPDAANIWLRNTPTRSLHTGKPDTTPQAVPSITAAE
ncbi:4Fe-4S dicluster domain-containing protein [candidate division KSB3 bacterium]|uniref:4Fe-4S dicluster domain-containing protein n=1 Tax=candidate division KSB3 bacterium TaxID=2044937 RepID=A0A9D5JVR2_9BACT|nr:4Fe-4S dicluster domain-containing protein [candidate division KSB3 bacterium]